MKIEGTEWYTACGTILPDEGHEDKKEQVLYGYRMPLASKTPEEITNLIEQLKSEGVKVKLRTSEHEHTGIPKGTPFLQVLDEKSAISLEKSFLKKGITLEKDRYKEHGLEYINRTPKQITTVVRKSFFDRLFGRK